MSNISAKELREKNSLLEQRNLIDARTTSFLFSDGSVDALAYNDATRKKVGYLSNVVSVASADYATFGLCDDGTVMASSLINGFFTWERKSSVCIPGWHDIIAISGGGNTSVAGLKKDGTVVLYDCDGIFLSSNWKDIVQISMGRGHLLGLKRDGTVLAAGKNDKGQCSVSDWTDIVHVSAGALFSVGVKADGSVVAVGDNEAGQCDVSEWCGIERVSAGARHAVGLASDGRVVSTVFKGPADVYGGQCDVAHWSDLDVIEISAGAIQTIGVRKNGTLISTVNELSGMYTEQFERLFKIVGCKLFDNYENLDVERQTKIAERAKKRELYERRIMGVCQYCGGKFKGLLTKKCTQCGNIKDY